MKKTLLILAIFLLYNTLSAALPKRNFVIEDHTGGWCGWCVRGIQVLEDLHANYSDRIIPLGLHNGDTMATATQRQLADTFKITGYPSGMINRKNISVGTVSGVVIDPDYWTAYIDANIQNATAIVNVTLNYSVDTAKKTLSADVSAEFFADYNSTQLSFNLAIVEDNVTGNGTRWYQSNYLSGTAGYETNPFYYKTNPIKNFIFQDVVRDIIGGIYGITDPLPLVIKTGDKFTHHFDVDLSAYPIQHYSNLWFAGIVKEATAKGQIINAVSNGKKPTPKQEMYISEMASDSLFICTKTNQSTVQTITASNKNSKDVKVMIKINPDESIIPNGWTYKLSDSVISIPAKSTKAFTITTTPSATPGCANYQVSTIVQSTDSVRGLEISTIAGVLSDNVKCAVIRYNGQPASSVTYLSNSVSKVSAVKDNFAFIPYTTVSSKVFDLNKFDIVLDCETYATRASTLSTTDSLCFNLNKLTLKGKPVLYTSCMNLWFIADNYGQMYGPNIKKLYTDTLGITGATFGWDPWWIWNGQARRADTINVFGFSPEKITEGLSFNLNEYDSTNYIYTAWLDMIKILDDKKAKPILSFNNPKIPANGNIAAVRIIRQNPQAKAIYQGFGFECIKDETVRTTLLNNYIVWLLSPVDVIEPGSLNNAALKAYPNPANEFINLEFSNSQTIKNSSIELISYDGERVKLICSGAIAAGNQKVRIDLSVLPSANYYITADLDGIKSICPINVVK
ncbi:MAG: Omp28-related outer membrane protein [Candidatus Kapabacteria bacterium]|nr:Omp28-related outer membrane protein [Candidatus Kapabacteria bacterium]